MIALVAAAAAAGTVLVLLRPAPRPARLAAVARRQPGAGRPRPDTVVAGIGRTIRQLVGLPSRGRLDRLTGAAALLVSAGMLVGPVLPAAAVAAVALRRHWRRLRAERREPTARTVADELPDLIDLLALTVGAGLTVPGALPVVARWAPPALRPAVDRAAGAIAAGAPAVEAVEAMAMAWGDDARPVARAVADHVRNGTPLLPVLDRLGADARARRRRAAETRARRLPVLLLFPLVLCTLPAFGLLTVAPIVAGTLRSLDGERLGAAASTTLPTEDHPCTPASSPPTWRRCPPPTGRPTP